MAQPRFEIPSGAIDGVNKVFTVSLPYVVGTMAVFLNGQLERIDFTDGWVETNPTLGEFELNEPPRPGDVVQVFFTDAGTTLVEVEVETLHGTFIDPEEELHGRVLPEVYLFGELTDLCGGKKLACSREDRGAPDMSILLPENAISVIRGVSKTLKLQVKDKNDRVVDLTGAVLYFSVKRFLTDRFPLIQKISNDAAQIEIPNPQDGIARINLRPDDTQHLDATQYKYDIWMISSIGQRFVVMPPSIFEVKAGVTVVPL